jgi:hypothetical protein
MLTIDHLRDMKSIKVKRTPRPVNKSPRDIIGTKNVTALKQAGFVVVPLSELSRLRANIGSVLDILPNGTARKG